MTIITADEWVAETEKISRQHETAYQTQYTKEHGQKHRNYSSLWYIRNRGKCLATHACWRKNNPDKTAAEWQRYYQKHREELLARKRLQRLAKTGTI